MWDNFALLIFYWPITYRLQIVLLLYNGVDPIRCRGGRIPAYEWQGRHSRKKPWRVLETLIQILFYSVYLVIVFKLYTLIMSFERYGWFIGRKFKFIFKLLKQVEEIFYFFGRFMMSLRRQRFLKFPSYPSLCESSSSSSLVILCFFIFLGKNRDGVAARNAFVSPVLVNTNKALTIYCSI